MIRPKYYIYDKNSNYLRSTQDIVPEEVQDVIETNNIERIMNGVDIEQCEYVRLERFMIEAGSDIKFEVGKRGGLNVRITKSK